MSAPSPEHDGEPGSGHYFTILDAINSFIEAEKAGLDPQEKDIAGMVPAEALEEALRLLNKRKWPHVPGYEVLEKLDEGAMGVVYKARQRALNRLVALKMIRSGESAKAGELAQFQIEAEAVARLQHPNIVQVYDFNKEQGQPWLSMEFVEGISLDKKAKGTPLPPREAAELVEKLAKAMQYAHRNGIIHRDLKPANVLLTRDGTPKIGDFGLAKRIDEDAGPTQAGVLLGTPSYMAPEQAERRLQDVGPLSDVYSLGAVLYELLTGRPPFMGPDIPETLRLVRTVEPMPPRRLQPKVPRDLETICLKCLQKDPARRYASAGELAADLRRFLAGEPILARPAPLEEVMWKWCKRRPVLALLLAALALLLAATVLSVLAGSRFYLRSEREAAAARASADIARKSLDTHEEMIDRLAGSEAISKAGLHDVVRDMLEGIVKLYEDLINRGGDSVAGRTARGRAYNQLAVIHRVLGEAEESSRACNRAEDVFEALVKDYPGERSYRFGLATARSNKAATLGLEGKHKEALEAAEAAEPDLVELADADPDRPEYRFRLVLCQNNLALCQRFLGNVKGAEEAFARALANLERLLRDHARTPRVSAYREWHARVLNNLGDTLMEANRLPEAEPILSKAVTTADALTGSDPGSVDARDALAACLVNWAEFHQRTRQFKQADETSQRCRDVYAALAAQFPRSQEYRWGVAEATSGVAKAKRDEGDFTGATKEFIKAVKGYDKLAEDYPRVADIAKEHGQVYADLARLYQQEGKPADAEKAANEAVGILSKLVEEHPKGAEYRAALEKSRTLLEQIRRGQK